MSNQANSANTKNLRGRFTALQIPLQHIGKIRPVCKAVISRISALKVNLWYSQNTCNLGEFVILARDSMKGTGFNFLNKR